MLFPFDKVRPFIHRNAFAACGTSDKVSIALKVKTNRIIATLLNNSYCGI